MTGQRPFSLSDLDRIIAARATADPQSSYTARLLEGGMEICARKLGEEAVETVISALGTDPEAVRNEAADLLFHLLIVLRAGGVSLESVLEELGRRTGQSGLEEKAGRRKD